MELILTNKSCNISGNNIYVEVIVLKNLAKKFLISLFVLFGVSILTFTMGRLAPGNPVETLLSSNPNPSSEDIKIAEDYLKINEPIYVQYISWLKRICKGDFGISYKTGLKVFEEVRIRFPNTMKLTFSSFVAMLLIAFPLGILSALYKNSILDFLVKIFNIMAISVPSFCIGILLMIVFGVKLRLLPTMGNDGFRSLILPSLSIGIGAGSGLCRLIRTQILNTVEKEHVKAAYVFGVSRKKIILNNILKNSMPPIVTNMGFMIGGMLGGSAIIETLFSWPGLGSYLISSIYDRDYPVIQMYAIVMAVIYMICNTLIDIINYILVPYTEGE